jgi:branched-chain amino acid transport system substrate-binding protein
MPSSPSLTRRDVLLGAAGSVLVPAAAASETPVRGVTDTEIIVGDMNDLSGVTAVLGMDLVNAMRMAFDKANERGGVHGRKIKFIVEDHQYLVPKAVQAMNKLLNRDHIFFALCNGGTPMNQAVMPAMFAQNVPNVFPTSCARSMYEPFNRLKFGHFASFYDQMRAGVKYFVERRGKKTIGAMTQDTDYGRDVLAGAVAQVESMGMRMAAATEHKPTDTDFNGAVAKLRQAGCDLVVMGTIVRDTNIILQTARKIGWDADFMGNFATYSTPVAELPGGAAEGFYSMAPGLYAYPDDPRPAVREFTREYRKGYGFDVNYFGETGYSAATFVLAALEKAGRELTLDSFIAALESMRNWQDIFGSPPLSLSPTNHQASNRSFLSVVRNARCTT